MVVDVVEVVDVVVSATVDVVDSADVVVVVSAMSLWSGSGVTTAASGTVDGVGGRSSDPSAAS